MDRALQSINLCHARAEGVLDLSHCMHEHLNVLNVERLIFGRATRLDDPLHFLDLIDIGFV